MALVAGIALHGGRLSAIALDARSGAVAAVAGAHSDRDDGVEPALEALGELATSLGTRRRELRAIAATADADWLVALDEAHAPVEPSDDRAGSARWLVAAKDQLGLLLSGTLATDDSSLVRDLAHQRMLPPVRDRSGPLGPLKGEIAERFGLPATTQVITGAAWPHAVALGCGALGERALVHLGPSALVHVPARGVFVTVGGTGTALSWYRDVLCDGEKLAAELRACEPEEIVCEAASTAPLGANDVLFLPRGVFVGLTDERNKADISRAVLEGIALTIARAFTSARQDAPVYEVRVSGERAHHPFVRQLLADALGCDVTVVTGAEPAAIGAAILAAVGAGLYDDVEQACDRLIHPSQRTRPDAICHERYRELSRVHAELGTALESLHEH